MIPRLERPRRGGVDQCTRSVRTSQTSVPKQPLSAKKEAHEVVTCPGPGIHAPKDNVIRRHDAGNCERRHRYTRCPGIGRDTDE
ncbi:hypothetical protein Pmi06nite_53960 [Planotetraspora mira]|uniref:Uncharacterized protein n=1 Tax=Planotetraspora mira TaxID=58121 RepID=A0A8J3X9K0_9ACTN|nr:hypothetical protein Pmi06nite_53960 [Planotetraspora mira]